MIKPTPTANESERLDFLLSLNILDTMPEDEFDSITKLASSCLDVPVSLISFIDKDRQWFKAKTGTDLCETSRDISFCGHALHDTGVMVVENADKDSRFFDNPLVTAQEDAIKFYAGIPLIFDKKYALGTLCLLDMKPREFSDKDEYMLTQLGKHVEKLIELRVANQKIKLQQEVLVEQHEKLDEALSMIEEAVAAQPQSGYIIDSLGWALYKLGRSLSALGQVPDACVTLGEDSRSLSSVTSRGLRPKVVRKYDFTFESGSWRARVPRGYPEKFSGTPVTCETASRMTSAGRRLGK